VSCIWISLQPSTVSHASGEGIGLVKKVKYACFAVIVCVTGCHERRGADALVSRNPDGGSDSGIQAQAQPESGPCSNDQTCETGFCDLGKCVVPTLGDEPPGPASFYGKACEPAIIGPYGTTFGPTDTCQPGYLCLSGHCRSCESAAECYEAVGLHVCSASSVRPGKQCRETSQGLSTDVYEPILTGESVPGRRLAAIDQPSGTPKALRLSLGSATLSDATRVAVVWWHQRSGEPDEFMNVAYDGALANGSPEVSISWSDVEAPYAENLICFRDCRDRAHCDCAGSPQVALATVILAIDRNADSALSLDEIRTEQVGASAALIGWAPVAQSSVPRGFEFIFASELRAGFAAYAAAKNEGPLSPVLAPDTVFDLAVCEVGDGACTFSFHGLLCYRACDRDWGLDRLGL
jgi:hypothetical protein